MSERVRIARNTVVLIGLWALSEWVSSPIAYAWNWVMKGHYSAEPLWLIVKLAAWAIPFVPGALLAGIASAYLFESPSPRTWAFALAIVLGFLGFLHHVLHLTLSDWPSWLGSLVFGVILTSACVLGWSVGKRFSVRHGKAA